MLALWSVGCTHCPEELKATGRLKAAHPGLDVVLVAADSVDDAPQAEKMAWGYGLGAVPQWIFADPMPERLRFEIDHVNGTANCRAPTLRSPAPGRGGFRTGFPAAARPVGS